METFHQAGLSIPGHIGWNFFISAVSLRGIFPYMIVLKRGIAAILVLSLRGLFLLQTPTPEAPLWSVVLASFQRNYTGV